MLIKSKYSPPRLDGPYVCLKATFAVGSVLDQKLATIVTAPSGYGKTTVLAKWRKDLIARGQTVAWLSLDEEDATSNQFIQYLVDAVRHAVVKEANTLSLTEFDEHQNTRWQLQDDALIATLNNIADHQAHVYLFLDDAHHLAQGDALKALQFLLKNAPKNFSIIIGSRTALNLKISKPFAAGLVETIEVVPKNRTVS